MNGLAKKLVIFVMAMGAVAAVGGFGRKAYKTAVEHRLLTQAAGFSKAGDYRNAELCLRRALQVNPLSVPAITQVGDMLETAGLPSAVGWRARAVQLQPQNATNRLNWAETALKFGDLKSADEALGEIKGNERGFPAYYKLAGALAWARRDAVAAETNYLAALRLEPANEAIALNLNTIRLSSTNREIVQAARKSLERLVDSPVHGSNATHILLQEAVARKSWSEALVFSRQLAVRASASFADKLAYLQLLRVSTNAQYLPWLETVKTQATNSPAEAFAFAKWLAASQGPGNALHWVQELPRELQTHQPVPLIVTDCKIALKDWPGLLASIDKQEWNEAEFYRCALESLAYRSEGNDYGALAAWHKALGASAHRLDRLSRLAQVTASWGWTAENTEVLEGITSEFPEEKWAATSLMAELYSAGKTSELVDFLRKRYTADPADVLIKNNLANLYLLRKSDLQKAFRLAREAHETAPKDPFFASTYAYSLLLQKKAEQAIQVLGELKPEYLQIPSVAAYYGVIQAESGHKDAARAALKCASTAKLLPEESELVRLAQARL